MAIGPPPIRPHLETMPRNLVSLTNCSPNASAASDLVHQLWTAAAHSSSEAFWPQGSASCSHSPSSLGRSSIHFSASSAPLPSCHKMPSTARNPSAVWLFSMVSVRTSHGLPLSPSAPPLAGFGLLSIRPRVAPSNAVAASLAAVVACCLASAHSFSACARSVSYLLVSAVTLAASLFAVFSASVAVCLAVCAAWAAAGECGWAVACVCAVCDCWLASLAACDDDLAAACAASSAVA